MTNVIATTATYIISTTNYTFGMLILPHTSTHAGTIAYSNNHNEEVNSYDKLDSSAHPLANTAAAANSHFLSGLFECVCAMAKHARCYGPHPVSRAGKKSRGPDSIW